MIGRRAALLCWDGGFQRHGASHVASLGAGDVVRAARLRRGVGREAARLTPWRWDEGILTPWREPCGLVGAGDGVQAARLTLGCQEFGIDVMNHALPIAMFLFRLQQRKERPSLLRLPSPTR